MSHSGFASDAELVRWVAGQFPNLPHIQIDLRALADGLDKQAHEAAQALVAKPANPVPAPEPAKVQPKL